MTSGWSPLVCVFETFLCSFALDVFLWVALSLLDEQGWCSGESARLSPMCPGFDSRTRRHMWVEFVVGSLLCSERFFSGFFGFPLSSKTNISKFQFELDYCQALYHEPLARVIAQALPVFDLKFTFTFFFCYWFVPSQWPLDSWKALCSDKLAYSPLIIWCDKGRCPVRRLPWLPPLFALCPHSLAYCLLCYQLTRSLHFNGGRAGLIIGALVCGASGPCSSPDVWTFALCSWTRHLTLTVPLSTHFHKWVQANLKRG